MAAYQVVITGGASGIGLAIAQKFLHAGFPVTVLDIKSPPDSADVSAIQFISTDITDPAAVIQSVAQLGDIPPGVLVNCAGIAHIGTLATTSPEDFDRVFHVNVKGAFLVSQAILPAMVTQRSGVIINLASIAASVGLPDRFAYSMSKGALLAMTYSIARDYVKYGIRCNSVSPARIHTPFVDGFLQQHYPGKESEMFERLAATQPIGRMGTPEEVASLVYYLASPEAAFITGTDFPIDGGFIRLNT